MERIARGIDVECLPQPEELLAMLDAARARYSMRTLPAGALIGWEKEPQPYAYFVASGAVEIFVVSKDGRKKVVDEVVGRGFFGFQIIREGCCPHATAQALVDSTVISISRESFFKALHCSAEFADLVTWYLYELLHAKTQEVAAQAFYPAHWRVALLLLEMADSASVEGDAQDGASVRLGNDRIADILGISRNSVTSSLSRLHRQGVVEKRRGSIFIRDVDALRAVVRQV